MSFELEVGRKTIIQSGEPVIECTIALGRERERFFTPVSFWARESYISQWKLSFREGMRTRRHSALITSMRDPLNMNFVFLWVLFYEGEKVFVRNKIIFLDEIDGEFNPDKVNEYVGSRIEFNEDGQRISEWVVSLSEVVACFEGLT